jgi:hypothetical protein
VEAIPGLEVIELPSNEGMMMFALAKRIQDLETATSWMKTQPGDLT